MYNICYQEDDLDIRLYSNCVIFSADVSIINTMKYFLTNWGSAKIHTHEENAASLGDYLNHTPLRMYEHYIIK